MENRGETRSSILHPPSSLYPQCAIVIGSLLLLFVRLGHYALWDDEAITAMTARAVWQTGDTSVRVDDQNLLVYRNGLLVRNFKDRYTPPLQFYLIAPFIGLLGDSNFVCRLPMALCGVITVGIILAWLRRAQPPPLVWWCAAIILLTNAEFFLFFRQCRYYGLAMMLSSAVAFLYCTRNPSLWRILLLSIALSALLAAQYLNYAVIVGCLVVDYLIWGRNKPIGIRGWLVILVPQLIVGAIVISIWNPLARQAGQPAYHSPSWISDRLHLLMWNWRDMIACNFVIMPLLLACPVLYFRTRSNWMLRAPMALVVAIFVLSLAVPTSLAQAHNAEVRYLAPDVPLCIGIGILAVWGMQALEPKLKWGLLALAGFSIFIDPTPDPGSSVFASTAVMYYHELAVPQVESYTPVIDWINTHVPAGSSIFVQPGYKAYPLMFRAGKAVYAWQLDDPPRADFKNLPDIQFFGRTAPDYLIRFGTNSESQAMDDARHQLAMRGIYYDQIKTIHLNWKDLYRPERLWRAFSTEPPKAGEEIYLYQKERG
jgi:hypothetical protein